MSASSTNSSSTSFETSKLATLELEWLSICTRKTQLEAEMRQELALEIKETREQVQLMNEKLVRLMEREAELEKIAGVTQIPESSPFRPSKHSGVSIPSFHKTNSSLDRQSAAVDIPSAFSAPTLQHCRANTIRADSPPLIFNAKSHGADFDNHELPNVEEDSDLTHLQVEQPTVVENGGLPKKEEETIPDWYTPAIQKAFDDFDLRLQSHRQLGEPLPVPAFNTNSFEACTITPEVPKLKHKKSALKGEGDMVLFRDVKDFLGKYFYMRQSASGDRFREQFLEILGNWKECQGNVLEKYRRAVVVCAFSELLFEKVPE